MDVSAIDNDVLAGGVRRLRRREQKDGSCGDFRRQSHAMAERNLVGDALEFGARIAERIKPAAIKRRHHFSGQDGVDADVRGQQFSSPLARKSKLRAFARGVTGGVALAGERDFGADVHDSALGAFERGQRMVSEGVIVDQIFLQALYEGFDRAALEACAVIDSGVVDQAVDVAMRGENFGDRGFAAIEVFQMRFDKVTLRLDCRHFGEKRLRILRRPREDDDACAFFKTCARDACADARAAARDDDEFIF